MTNELKGLPTEPGWNWWRELEENRWEPIRVIKVGGATPDTGNLCAHPKNYPGPYNLDILGGQWGGPIKEPSP